MLVPNFVQGFRGVTENVSASATPTPSNFTVISFPDALNPPVLKAYYESLFTVHGPQNWWPARSRFEVVVGAILVQNTSWMNAERAIRNLRRERLLSVAAIHETPSSCIAKLIRSAGYFRQKTRTIKGFASFVEQRYQGSLTRMFRTLPETLRVELLSLHGIGRETADSILLYAGKHPTFVIDTYTRRVLERHGLASPEDSYEQLRHLFESQLPRDQRLFNEFHALLVLTGKVHCRKLEMHCDSCPLGAFLPKQ